MKSAVLLVCLAWATAAFSAEPLVWHLDQSAALGGHELTIMGAPQVVTEPAGKAMVFNGSSDGILIPVNPLAGSPVFTIEILFKPEEGGLEAQRFFHLEDTKSWRVMIETRLDGHGTWWLDTFLGAKAVSQPLIDPKLLHPTGRWYWVALRFDGKHMTNFVDGKQELDREAGFGPMVEGQLSLGVRQNKVHWFKGAIREVRWHTEAIPTEKLQKQP